MTPDEVLARLAAPLSLRRRVGYLAVGLAGLTGSALISLLWATEPGLPQRTKVAFAVLASIGLWWAAFAGWVVTRRAPLFALDRVIAGWLGVAAWLTFTVGALITTISRHRLGLSLVGVVLALGVLAAVNLWGACRTRGTLMRRRAELAAMIHE